MSEWELSLQYFKRGENFTIEVHRHSVLMASYGQGVWRWCVYVYVFPTHPLYDSFDVEEGLSGDFDEMPLHGGCTYFKMFGETKKIGCDYNHAWDERYTHMETMEDASSIFRDADQLFNYFQERSK